MLDLFRNENVPGLQICHLLCKEKRLIHKYCNSNMTEKNNAHLKTVQLYVYLNSELF